VSNRPEAWFRLATLVVAAFLTAFVLASGSQGPFAIIGNLQGPLAVERIIDGDTFVLVGDERVRIIGVDAPEVGEPFADTATEFLASLIEDRPIFIELDVGERDVFGRLLANVFVEDTDGPWVADDGRRFVQVSHALAAAGLADLMTVPPNVAYAEILLDATRAARDAGLGFWAPWTCVDLNTASHDRLMEIIHIGEVRVDGLISRRPYTRIEQLDAIPGIGPKRMEDIIEQGIICPLE